MAKTIHDVLTQYRMTPAASTAAPTKTAEANNAPVQAQPQYQQKVAQEFPAPFLIRRDLIKTAAQAHLLNMGVFVADPRMAANMCVGQDAVFNNLKVAEVQKEAEELMAQGRLQALGAEAEKAAMYLADTGGHPAAYAHAQKIASRFGNFANDAYSNIVKRAQEAAHAASSTPALWGNHIAYAAGANASATQSAAPMSRNTVEYMPADAAGMRSPVSGDDANTTRMVTPVYLPGNPGLNGGMAVEGGR